MGSLEYGPQLAQEITAGRVIGVCLQISLAHDKTPGAPRCSESAMSEWIHTALGPLQFSIHHMARGYLNLLVLHPEIPPSWNQPPTN